jgi:hypothetical protein
VLNTSFQRLDVMFTNYMSKKATIMSLSILVVVEMFNAINNNRKPNWSVSYCSILSN